MTPLAAPTSVAAAVREPNFFLVGASRAGTTSLVDHLTQHPDVYMPGGADPKEPSHFCELTPSWAARYREEAAYLELFRAAGSAAAVGDGSTTYLPSPESPWRIRSRFPGARILIVLRNPADRAFSLYTLLCELGFEWLPTFERALAEEDARTASERFRVENPFWFYAYQYFRSGLYADQVERYLTAFPPERVKVVLFEDLRRDAVATTRELYRFLDVDPGFAPAVAVHNRSTSPFSVRLQRALGAAWRTHPLKSFDGPPRAFDRMIPYVFWANLRLGALRRRAFAPETRRELLRRYAADVRRTSDLVGRDLTPWTRGEEVGPA